MGQPLPGTTVRIAEDGEILVKGPQVFQLESANRSVSRAESIRKFAILPQDFTIACVPLLE